MNKFIILWIIIFCQLIWISLGQPIASSQYYSVENEVFEEDYSKEIQSQNVFHFAQNDSYIPHGPMTIYDDNDFITYGFPGNGTDEDPYRIENYNITTSINHGIFVGGTTKFFVIQYCFINAPFYGIGIGSTAHYTGRVSNNICFNSTNGNGISILGGRPIVVNNTSCGNRYGIAIDHPRTIVENNICYNNSEGGIYITSVLTSALNNDVFSNKRGIQVRNSIECNISGNTLSSNLEGGIFMYNSQNSSILNNVFINDGLVIEYGIDLRLSVNYTIENNIVNGKPLGYFANSNRFTISEDFGQILLINCTRVNISSQHIYDTLYGIDLLDCGKVQVKNCFFENNFGSGIRTQWSNNLLIVSNNFTQNYIGLLIDTTNSYWVIYNNFIENIDYAITTFNLGSIHHNNFINNNQKGSYQAYSGSSITEWYDKTTLEGNYWSDWDGEGTYNVHGSSDLFPLSEPVEYFPTNYTLPWITTPTTRNSFPIAILLYLVLIPLFLKRRKNYG